MPVMPSPSDFGRRPRTELTARPVMAKAKPPAAARRTPAVPPTTAPYRARYEHAVRLSGLDPRERLVALTVASWADYETGLIPVNAAVGVDALARSTGLTVMAVRFNLHALAQKGWLQRTERAGGARVQIALTLPDRYQDAP
jgi:hypothetical protein